MLRRRLDGRAARTLAFASFVAVLVSVGVTSATGAPPIPLIRDGNMANLGQNERELSIAVDPNNPNVLASGANQRNGTQEWYISTNGGRAWTNGALPNGTLTVAGTTTTLMSDPSLAFGSNGEAYYSALMHGATNEPCTLFVSVTQPPNLGTTWSDPANGIVATGNSANPNAVLCNDKEMILVDRQQNDDVYVAWTPIDPTSAPNDRQLAVSVDRGGIGNGLNFSAPTFLTSTCFNHGADIAEAPNGNLYIAWTQFCSGVGDGAAATVLVSNSTNQGASWSAPATAASINNVSPTGVDANFRSRSFPSIAVDAANRVYVTYGSYATAPTTDANIYVTSSANGSTSWSTPTRVNQDSGTSEQVMPWIGIANGRMAIDYYSRSGDGTNWNLNLAYGAPSATPTFTETTISSAVTAPGTGFLGDYVGLAIGSDDVIHPAWGDGRAGVGGSTDGFSARVDFSPPSSVTISPATPSVEVGNNQTFTATVKGAGGEAEQFIPVKYTVVSSGNPSATSASGTSNASGQFQFTYTNTKSGTDTVKVWADLNEDGAETSDEDTQTTITWTPGPPASLVLSPSTATTQVTQQHCVTATVKDKYGNAVAAGWKIRFSVSGGAPTSGTILTDSSGLAPFCYSGPSSIFAPTGIKWGADSISAFADNDGNGSQNGTEPSGTASNTWKAGDPVSLTLSPATASKAVGTQDCISAVARDVFGNPTEGITIRFKVTGANTASGSQVTNTIGHAPFCYTGTAAGSDTLAAFADSDVSGTQNGGEPGTTASVTWCTKKCH